MVNSMFSVCRTMKDLGAFLWISIRNQCWKFKVNVNNLLYFSLGPNQHSKRIWGIRRPKEIAGSGLKPAYPGLRGGRRLVYPIYHTEILA